MTVLVNFCHAVTRNALPQPTKPADMARWWAQLGAPKPNIVTPSDKDENRWMRPLHA